MQRARRRKLQREAQRDPFLLQVKRGRDLLRHVGYGGLNRDARKHLQVRPDPAIAEAVGLQRMREKGVAR